jgi:uncharacterized phage protein (TIGR01671 family)
MREIKFRAWDKITNKMYYAIERGSEFDKQLPFKEYLLNPIYIVMQYTGLKDKHGKEIFEGDIIKDDDWGFSPSPVIISVEFVADEERMMCGFYMKEKEGYFNSTVAGWQKEKIEVIGNIYENPELLKEGSKDEQPG